MYELIHQHNLRFDSKYGIRNVLDIFLLVYLTIQIYEQSFEKKRFWIFSSFFIRPFLVGFQITKPYSRTDLIKVWY